MFWLFSCCRSAGPPAPWGVQGRNVRRGVRSRLCWLYVGAHIGAVLAIHVESMSSMSWASTQALSARTHSCQAGPYRGIFSCLQNFRNLSPIVFQQCRSLDSPDCALEWRCWCHGAQPFVLQSLHPGAWVLVPATVPLGICQKCAKPSVLSLRSCRNTTGRGMQQH